MKAANILSRTKQLACLAFCACVVCACAFVCTAYADEEVATEGGALVSADPVVDVEVESEDESESEDELSAEDEYKILLAQALDETATGSINLTMIDTEGANVGGGTLTFYKVADLNKNTTALWYTYADAFADYDFDITSLNIDTSDSELGELAAALAAYVEEMGIEGQDVAVDASGNASLIDASLGLYLVVQTTAADGYYAVSPFLVTVPMSSDGEWIYDVDATPKVEAASIIPVVEEEEPEATGDSYDKTGDFLRQYGWAIALVVLMFDAALAYGLRQRRLGKAEESE